jgi:alpha-beta hydrolase superfamily lysophospholipase
MIMKNPWKRHEGYFSGYNGHKLFYQEWAQPKPKGLFVITHGHGEHSECYHRLVDGLYESGWNCISWDWRGHGRSEGKRGYAGHFSHYVWDYQKFLELLSKQEGYKDVPWITLSHSMGGLIQTHELMENKLNLPIKAQVLSAPLFGLRVEVPLVKDIAALTAFHVYPKLTLWNELKPEQFSRDPAILDEYSKDPLRHDRLSPGVYIGFLQAFEFIHKHAPDLKLPTLMQLGGLDTVVSNVAAEQFFDALGSPLKTKHVYHDSLHEIYNDLDRQNCFNDILNFIQPFSVEPT